MSQRTARLDELLREEISAVISRDVTDPRIGFVTVTDVEVTSDLSRATVWVSILGSPEDQRASLAGLHRAMPYVRVKLGRLRLKTIPQLHVRQDDSAERATRLLDLIEHPVDGTESLAPVRQALPTPSGVAQGEAVLPVEPRRRRRRRSR